MSAEAIRDFYRDNPGAGIDEVAEELGLQPNVVHRIMDTHWVQEDGTIEEVGPGQGGGWAPPAEMAPLESEEIGHRWPDGELREDVFDIHNEMHRQIVNLSDADYQRMAEPNAE